MTRGFLAAANGPGAALAFGSALDAFPLAFSAASAASGAFRFVTRALAFPLAFSFVLLSPMVSAPPGFDLA